LKVHPSGSEEANFMQEIDFFKKLGAFCGFENRKTGLSAPISSAAFGGLRDFRFYPLRIPAIT
jgi:hypothetical protein